MSISRTIPGLLLATTMLLAAPAAARAHEPAPHAGAEHQAAEHGHWVEAVVFDVSVGFGF